jgi:hypothetical protein
MALLSGIPRGHASAITQSREWGKETLTRSRCLHGFVYRPEPQSCEARGLLQQVAGRNRAFIGSILIVAAACACVLMPTEANAQLFDRRAKPPQDQSLRESRGSMNSAFKASLPSDFKLPRTSDEVSSRVLVDYGAVFVARGGTEPPTSLVFADEESVGRWQSSVKQERVDINGIIVELQAPAMRALLKARAEAQRSGLDITPRAGDASSRTYAETVQLWLSRVNPGLTHQVRRGLLSQEEADQIRALSPYDQISQILRLEARGLLFSTDFSKSILYSVAAPGTSQHISLLAFDVKEHDNPKVRAILAKHGWFQTISADAPHFTFIGVKADELVSLGLKKTIRGGRVFWIPDL